MRVSVFGLGYVGCVSAGCLAELGHDIIGVDTNVQKVAWMNAGRCPIIEPSLDALVQAATLHGRLRATVDAREAVLGTDVSLVCVGTPAVATGGQDLSFVQRVCADIGAALRFKTAGHTVIIRSTVLPGTTETVVVPSLERASGRKAGEDFTVVVHPEFLREGSGVEDFFSPPFVVLGIGPGTSIRHLDDLYRTVRARRYVTDWRTAEMVKYACNAFHALKVTFANEIGRVCQALGVDPFVLMEIFVADTRLNLSPAYLRPGMAFGGSCLPKDLGALLQAARGQQVDLPVLAAVPPSNARHLDLAVDVVLGTGRRQVGIIGLSFKPGTDDLRDSTPVYLVRRLLDHGLTVRAYDDILSRAELVGANREFAARTLPELSTLLADSLDTVIEHAEVLVIAHPLGRRVADVLRRVDHQRIVVDLVGIDELRQSDLGTYIGLCWKRRNGRP